MKKFPTPELEVVRFDSKIDADGFDLDISDEPCSYNCPSMYGNACATSHNYNPSDPPAP